MKWSEVGQSLKAKLSLLMTAGEAPNPAVLAREALEATRAVAR